MIELHIEPSLKIEESERASLLDSEVYDHIFSEKNVEEIAEEFSGLGYSKEIVNKYFSRLKRRFKREEVGGQTYYELYDLLTDPDNFSKANLLENLMKKEFKGLKKIGEIMKYDSDEETWRGIDRLGLEYFQEIQKGYGNSVENRSQRQIRIVNEIVERTRHPYIINLVEEFLEKGKAYAPGQKEFFEDEEGEERVKVSGIYFNSNKIYMGDKEELRGDLINEVLKNIIQEMHLYRPEVGSMSGFIKIIVNGGIIRYSCGIPFSKISNHNFNNFCRIVSKSDSKEEAIDILENLLLGEDYPSWHPAEVHPLSPALVYDSLMGTIKDFDDLDEEDIIENYVPSPYFDIAKSELKNLSMSLLKEKRFISGENEYQKRRNKDIVYRYFLGDGETLRSIGHRNEITQERVRQISLKFERKVRTHFRRGMNRPSLEDLIELFREVDSQK